MKIGDVQTFKAEVVRVVDGDTLDCRVDLGFGVSIQERFRLDGVNTPEIFGDERERGNLATQFVRGLLDQAGNQIRLLVLDRGKYGRWIARITLADGQDLSSAIVSAGHGSPT